MNLHLKQHAKGEKTPKRVLKKCSMSSVVVITMLQCLLVHELNWIARLAPPSLLGLISTILTACQDFVLHINSELVLAILAPVDLQFVAFQRPMSMGWEIVALEVV